MSAFRYTDEHTYLIYLILDDLNPYLDAHVIFERLLAPDIQTDRGVKFKGIAACGDLGAAVHDADLRAYIVLDA